MHEVRRRLGEAGYREALVEGAIVRLVELGMLDDEAFARSWVESRDRARPRGERALRVELARKGIAAASVDAVLETRRDEAAEEAAARHDDDEAEGDSPEDVEGRAADRLVARNERALLRVADPRTRRQRTYALLARNGFDPDTCSSAARRAEARWGLPDES